MNTMRCSARVYKYKWYKTIHCIIIIHRDILQLFNSVEWSRLLEQIKNCEIKNCIKSLRSKKTMPHCKKKE